MFGKFWMEHDEGMNAIIQCNSQFITLFCESRETPTEPRPCPPALISNQYSDSAPHLHIKLGIRLVCTDVMEDYTFLEQPSECVFDCVARPRVSCELLLQESLFMQTSAIGPIITSPC